MKWRLEIGGLSAREAAVKLGHKITARTIRKARQGLRPAIERIERALAPKKEVEA